MEIYQWLVPLLALFFLIRLSVQYAKGSRSLLNTVLWSFTAISAALLAIIPDVISFSIANKLGFKSNINAVIFLGLGLSLAMNYFQSIRINKLESRLTELVRKIALNNSQAPEKL